MRAAAKHTAPFNPPTLSCPLPPFNPEPFSLTRLKDRCLWQMRWTHQGKPEEDAALAAARPSVTVASVSHSSRSQYGLSAPAGGADHTG